jgi:hypothetical protein
MNTNNNENVAAPVKKGRGRPIVPTATKLVRVNPSTGTIYGKGRVKAGTRLLICEIHRSHVKNFALDRTPILSQKEVTVGGENAAPIAINIQAQVIQPAPEVAAPVDKIEIPA